MRLIVGGYLQRTINREHNLTFTYTPEQYSGRCSKQT